MKKTKGNSIVSRLTEKSESQKEFIKEERDSNPLNFQIMSLVPSAPPLYPQLPGADREAGLSQLYAFSRKF